MLAIQIASDLHLEFYSSSKGGLPPFEEIIQPSAPVLALVGDISVLTDEKGKQLYEAFLAEACGRFKTVVVVLGNHEFYSKHERGNDRHIPPVTMDKVIAYVRGLKGPRFPNLELLDNDGVTLDGVRVLGSTLWSDVPPSATQAVERGLNDYHRIFIGAEGGVPRRLRVADTNRLHAEAVAWIERETTEAKDRGLSVVVLTHHTPSFRGTSNPVYAGSPIASAFSTDLEHLMGADATSAIHIWCYGHTHYNNAHTIKGVRLVSNQRGYMDTLADGYRHDCVINVPTSPSSILASADGCDSV